MLSPRAFRTSRNRGDDSLPDNSFQFNDAVQLARAEVIQYSALVSSYNAQKFPDLLKQLKKQFDAIGAAEDAYANDAPDVRKRQDEQKKLRATKDYDKQRDSELTDAIKTSKREARQAVEAEANRLRIAGPDIADLPRPNELAEKDRELSSDIQQTKMSLKELFSTLNADYLKSKVTIVIPAPYVSGNSLEQFTLTVTDNYKPLVWKEASKPANKGDDTSSDNNANPAPSPATPSGTSANLQLSAPTPGTAGANAAPVQVSKSDNGSDTSTVTASFIVPFHRVVHFAAIGGFLAVKVPSYAFQTETVATTTSTLTTTVTTDQNGNVLSTTGPNVRNDYGHFTIRLLQSEPALPDRWNRRDQLVSLWPRQLLR